MRNFGDYVTLYDKFKEFSEQLKEFLQKLKDFSEKLKVLPTGSWRSLRKNVQKKPV